MCHPQVTNFSQVTNFQFMQYAILCCICGNYNFLNYNSSSFDLSHLYNICTHTHTHKCKIMCFNENIRSNKDYGQIERKKLKYLHYLNKMIQKCKTKKFIFSEVSCFKPELFQRFHLDFKGLHSSYGMQ